MINIYKLVEKDGDINPLHVDTWDDGKFSKSSAKMDRDEVVNTFNRGYYFTSETKDKTINKFEIPDEILEQAGIDPKKLSPNQLKAMFAKLNEKGLLKPKSGDKKSADKPSGKSEPEGDQGSRPGLVKKKVTVHRGGKTFQQERLVKAGEDGPTEKPKKGDPNEVPKAVSKPKGPVIRGLNKPENGESSGKAGKDNKSDKTTKKESITEDKTKIEVVKDTKTKEKK